LHRRWRIAERIQIAQSLLFVGREAAHELGVVKSGFPLRWRHVIEHSLSAENQQAPLRRERLPARQQVIANVLLLFGRHPVENFSANPDIVSLFGRKLVPLLEILANLRLTLGREAFEAGVVLHEAVLLFRR